MRVEAAGDEDELGLKPVDCGDDFFVEGAAVIVDRRPCE